MQLQILDIDYIANGANGKPVIRIFGRTDKGNVICAIYDKFLPYFYVQPDEKTKKKLQELGLSFEETERYVPIGYRKDPTKLLKITLTNPQDVPKIREQIEPHCQKIFESDILFKYRFMVDFGLRGMSWVDLDSEYTTTRNITVPTHYVNSMKPVEKNTNVQLSHLAFDIECLSEDPRRQPDSKQDKIIMISIAFDTEYSGKKSIVLVAKPVKAKNAKGFVDEKSMLEEFLTIIEKFDPDVITGYNINGFDLPYLLDRLKKNNIPAFFGRSKDKQAFMRNMGMMQECFVPGRVVADPYQILKRDPWVKFNSYKLDSIAKELLNEHKLDVEYSEIPKLWAGTREEMQRLVDYSRKDAELSLRLLLEKRMLDKFFELCKISGILLQDSFGGQSSRIDVMLLHEFKSSGHVMPTRPDGKELSRRIRERKKKELKGAAVLEPKKGLHAESCTLVLDFKSLYPSIMRTYNISPDTIIMGDEAEHIRSSTDARYVKRQIYTGILPKVLAKLIDARTRVKKQMRSANTEQRKLLNAKQLALKDIANSIYGYTGYIKARLYMLDVANTITAYGRNNIEKTKNLIEDNFSAEVVYGDTDSIFLKTSITNLEEAEKFGNTIAKRINDELPGHLELEFEKTYRTFLILTKKRYAGWKFVFDNGWKEELEMKGIETVRRDWCILVSDTMRRVLNLILKEGDVSKAISFVQDVQEKLKKGEIPLEKLTIVKGITKSIDSYEGMQPHIELARKMNNRNPSEAPKVGDRLGFVITRGSQMLSKRAEDPKYVERHKIPIDSNYYLYNQLLPPMERIFDAVGVTTGEILGEGRQTNITDIGKPRRQVKIKVDYKKQTEILGGCEGFVCNKCGKNYRRIPLQGLCECGGELLMSYHGSKGMKMVSG